MGMSTPCDRRTQAHTGQGHRGPLEIEQPHPLGRALKYPSFGRSKQRPYADRPADASPPIPLLKERGEEVRAYGADDYARY
jgi:hypothetical protein